MRRTLGLLIIFVGVGLILSLGFGVAGTASPWFAVLAAISLIILMVFQQLWLHSWRKLSDAVEQVTNDPEGEIPVLEDIGRARDDIWLPLIRLIRIYRHRIDTLRHECTLSNQVLSALPDALLIINQHREIIEANEAARELFGDYMIQRDVSLALRQPAVLKAVDAVLEGGPDRLVDVQLHAPVELQMSARIAPIGRRADRPPQPDPYTKAANDSHPARHSVPAALITLHDLTSIRRTEQMRVDFVANASHELRTPLAALAGFIETLQGPAANDLDAQQRFLSIMSQQATRMSRVIDDLLSLSRIELNEHQPPTDRVYLPQILQSVAQMLSLKAEQRNMRIEFDWEDHLPNVIGDAEELTQVFQNLIENALKYGRDGTPVKVILRSSARLRPGLAISVSDKGEGIPRKHLPRLTERFYRVDTARSRQMGGTGLGLAIVKHIVSRHRGLLEIESTLGEGSSFTVHLRAVADVAQFPKAPTPLDQRPDLRSG